MALERAALVATLVAACGGAGHGRRPPACPTGPVTIASAADVAAVAHCRALPALTIRTGAPLDLGPLRELEEVGGDLVIGPTLALTEARLPALARVGGNIRVTGNGELGGVYLPVLTQAGGLALVDNASITTLSAPALATLAGPLALERDAVLATVVTDALHHHAGGVVLTDLPALALWLGADVATTGVRLTGSLGLSTEDRQRLFGAAQPDQ